MTDGGVWVEYETAFSGHRIEREAGSRPTKCRDKKEKREQRADLRGIFWVSGPVIMIKIKYVMTDECQFLQN